MTSNHKALAIIVGIVTFVMNGFWLATMYEATKVELARAACQVEAKNE